MRATGRLPVEGRASSRNNADLREPFDRVREALGETARLGGLTAGDRRHRRLVTIR